MAPPPAPSAGAASAAGSIKRAANLAVSGGAEGSTPREGPKQGPPPIPPMFGPGGPVSAADCQAAVDRLTNPKTDLREKTALAIELRDTADNQRDAAYSATYLSILVPKVIQLLLEGNPGPSFIKDSPENRLRGTLLTFLQRLPHNETLKPHTQKLMETALELLKRENEENALHCIKIIIDGFRSHKEQTEQHVKPFLELVKQMYANTRSVVEKEFGAPASEPGAASNVLQPQNQAPATTPTPTRAGGPQPSPAKGAAGPSKQGPGQAEPIRLPQALYSPKVLTECPIAVVLIFQSFKQLMHTAMQDFYPLVMDSIAIQPEPQRQAYLAAEAKSEIFTGVAEGIKNREMYTEVIKAQVKTMAFLAYVLRGSADNIKMYLDVFPVACVRLLRDCPPEDVATRKELLIATRHILSSEFRAAFIPHVDILLDERVLVGSGVTSREALRPLAYSTLADLIHHVRSDLSQEQLTRVIAVYSHITHDPTYSLAIQNMCAKLLLSSIDSLCTKGNRGEAIKLMSGMLDASVRKVGSLYRSFDRAKRAAVLEKEKNKPKEDAEVVAAAADVDMDAGDSAATDNAAGPNELEWREVERAMPVAAPNSALESLESFLKEARSILKTLFHTFRSLLNNLRIMEAPPILGDVLGALFRNSILALRIFEGARDPREEKDALELFGLILTFFQPHVFAEVWTSNMPFFVDQVLENPHSITLLQSMLVHADVSHQTVAILLKYLMGNLETIGSQDKTRASLTLKLFKLSFMAVNSYIEQNEPVLVPHLAKLIIESFGHAAKAADPLPYYQILRALFRSIGGGRFEALYKEVLPILEEMLETLNYLLAHSEPGKKDLFVELCLTVPVRLTNLLPHLGYLMKPLVHALNAGSDLVSQGLRTLELCIDNLTSEFLDPTMGPVFRDLMSALYNLLQPLPFNHQHSHSAVKILGKLGGRNRRFQQRPYLLDYRPIEENISISLTFENRRERLAAAGWIDTAARAVSHSRSHYRLEAIKLLKQTSNLFLQNRVLTVGQEPIFQRNIKALYAALPYEDAQADVKEYLRAYSKAVLEAELNNQRPRDGVLDRRPSLLTVAYITAVTVSTADCNEADREAFEPVIESILDDFLLVRHQAFEEGPSDETRMNSSVILQCFFSKFIGLCFEEDWRRKLAGCAGLRILTEREQLEAKWTVDRQLEFVRAIFFALRDAPKDAPRSLASVVALLKAIITKCNTHESGVTRVAKLIDMLVLELPSHKAIVRETAQECIELLAGMKEQSIHDLIVKAAKERLLDTTSSPIFNKPLRALPFGMQIGNMDAITYLLTLRPSLPEINDELVRLVHETIALADADDASLIGRVVHHAAELSLRSLRVACLKLLCAAMSFPDIFSKQPTSKTKIIAVYFKHMYSPSPQIVQIAHEGLKTVLSHQAKLPKEILQTGLRPILVNLADAKRLSVSGLEGLSRFLELLTNYFKVEIGQKLLDHFRTLADPAMLTQAAERPYEDNSDIARMVRLVNVFRLLPPTANTFLKDLTMLVVDTESKLYQSRPGPFTTNLALYFERYSTDAVAFLLDNLGDSRVVRSLRYVITCGQAPTVVEDLSAKVDKVCDMCFRDTQQVDAVLHGIQLISDLSKTSDNWMVEHMEVLKALVAVWRQLVSGFRKPEDQAFPRVFTQEPALLLEIFMDYLGKNQHVELFFHVVEALEIRNVFDCADVPYFFYQQVAQPGNVSYKREILDHFFTIFGDNTVSQTFKTNAFRVVVNPLLFVHYTRPADADARSLMTPEIVARTKDEIWNNCLERYRRLELADDLMVELLHMATIFAQHHIAALEGSRKFVAKVAWECMSAKDATLRHVAYLLSARFLNVDPATSTDKPGQTEKSRLQLENEKHRLNLVRTTWTGLLKSKETEARAIYRRAVDVMASCLPVQDPAAEGGVPHWAYVAKMVLVEEGHTTPQLVAICELIVTHGDLFYGCRDLFVGLMANSLTKLGFVPGATPEMKKLTIDIVELIFRWERRRMTASPALRSVDSERNAGSTDGGPPKRQRVDTAGTAISSSSSGGWQLPVQVRELITSYLVRLVSTSQESLHRHGLTERALKLLREILSPQGLPGVTAKLSFFQRTMGIEIAEPNLVIVCNSAEVVAIVALNKDKAWLNTHLGTLLKLLEHPVLSDYAALHDTLRPILVRMFGCIPAPGEDQAIGPDQLALATWADNIVNNMNSGTIARLHGSLFVIQCYVSARPEKMTDVLPGITKLMNRLTKDLTSLNVAMGQADAAHRAIINILQLCRSRIDAFENTDTRRSFVSAMAHLIEHCQSSAMARYILEVVRDWILKDPNAAYPTLKEKAGLLGKMMVFEQRGDDELLKNYLELILDVFNEPILQKSELTTRAEHPFLLGTRCKDPVLRFRFVAMLDDCLPKDSYGRLQYVLSNQSWEYLNTSYWITLATDLLLGAMESQHASQSNAMEVDNAAEIDVWQPIRAQDVIAPLRQLLPLDDEASHEIWTSTFSAFWLGLPRAQQLEASRWLTMLLAKEHHASQIARRPNVVQSLLSGVLACGRSLQLPPFVVKYLGKTHNAWHIAMEILANSLDHFGADDQLRDTCADALTELYAELSEDDLFYGLWRRRALHDETNAALALEQNGLWPRAQELYELAQSKARAGSIPYSESEYSLWQDHWILAAQKLQQWDILTDLARHEGNHDLLLECAWRLSDWGSADREMIERTLKAVDNVATPRRKVFEAYTALIKAHTGQEKPADFMRVLDEAIQLAIRRWVSFPKQLSSAHIPLLQLFQQYVELQEAASVFESLTLTNQQNLEARVTQDLKPIFQTWRERLPNFWDDISVWSDLLAWRQHVFSAVTKVYVPLIPQHETATYGYRGYHETAWTINRFGHVARKHQLSDVCTSALGKIYALPNIEISEAFLKLREQAMCYYQKPDKFAEGLESISTTNLMYFAPAQKAEFLTLKGMFIAKLGQTEEANLAFAQAVQMDLNLPKAWAEWGRFNDRLFRDRPAMPGPQPEPQPGEMPFTDQQWIQKHAQERIALAANAVSCYLQAAGLYKSAKGRKLLMRVLWLLSLDDASGAISKAFEAYAGDSNIWYWITLIPQLLLSLSHREARHARSILMKIAKVFPQALFYHLRTTKEDFTMLQRSHLVQLNQRRMLEAKRNAAAQAAARAAAAAAGEQQQREASGMVTAASAAASADSPATTGDAATKVEQDVKTEEPAATTFSRAPPTIQIDQAPIGDSSRQPESGSSRTPASADAQPAPEAAAPPAAAAPAADPAAPTTAEATQAEQPATANIPPQPQSARSAPGGQPGMPMPQAPRMPQELLDEILSILKTAFPLLALSMEKMVDHINVRAQPPKEEDVYRFFFALLSDAMGQWASKLRIPTDDELVPQATLDKIKMFISNHAREIKTPVETQFLRAPLKLREYIHRMQKWHDQFERALDARPHREALDHGQCLLSDFHHSKFDDVEVPGQYIEHVDSNADFAKIGRFAPTLELARGYGFCFRRITMIGNNGANHTFAVQSPSGRHCRREERLTQLFRIMNTVLQKRKESRKRNLSIHLPAAIPLTPSLRLVAVDNSYLTLQDVFDEHCREKKMLRDKPMLSFIDKFRQVYQPSGPTLDHFRRDFETVEYKVARMEAVEEIATKYVPEDVLTKFMTRTMSSPSSLWLMRKQFALQTASAMFLSHVACCSNRAPSRFHFSLRTGMMYMSEVLPSFDQQEPLHRCTEHVPFRLTPNMQHFITPTGVEGLLTSAVMAMARSLTSPEFDLPSCLSLFLRDEVLVWFHLHSRPPQDVPAHIMRNAVEWNNRTEEIAFTGDANDKNDMSPIVAPIITLIAKATNTQNLAMTAENFSPYF